MRTILQGERGVSECYLCGNTQGLHEHHVFYGTGNRKISEKYGFKVKLCGIHHNLSNDSVHQNNNLDIHLKKHFQRLYEIDGTREEFIKLIGRSYL